jgi:putative exosortase-associated protein (TIGR04073 family)
MRLPVTVLLLLTTVPHLSFAEQSAEQPLEQCPFSAALENQDLPYPEKAGNMFARGALNAGFGWTEIIMNTTIEAKREGNIMSGLLRGMGQGITRTANGFGELFTFWVPKVGPDYLTFSTDSPLDMHNEELRQLEEKQAPPLTEPTLAP